MDCQPTSDQCRRTAKYKVVGQNMFHQCSTARVSSIPHIILEGVNNWFNQRFNLHDLNEIYRLQSTAAPTKIQLFTQMVQSKANRIGCSAVSYLDNRNWNCVLIGCNYNAGNLQQYPVYTVGPLGSQCRWGRNPNYPGLCSVNEDYSTHLYGNMYFNNNTWPSPVVTQWLRNGKRLDTGFVNPNPIPGAGRPVPNPHPGTVRPPPIPNPYPPGQPQPNPNPGAVRPQPNPNPNPGGVQPQPNKNPNLIIATPTGNQGIYIPEATVGQKPIVINVYRNKNT